MCDVYHLPYLTADVPGVGGVMKSRPADFVVEEVPLYEASGEGTHVYFRIEKTGVATMQAVRDIARALGRQARDVGYAGLKDADAVTTQTLSIEHIVPERIETLSLAGVRVLDVSRHTNKLKLGHLRGNRFRIRLREVDTERVADVRAIMATLARRGVPNYFGPQRFGMRGDTWEIGRAVLADDYEKAVAVMLGRPGPDDYGEVLQARELFDKGDYSAAAGAWPFPFSHERRVCRAMAKSGDARQSFRAADKQIRQFYISAYQSHLFNQIVAGRLESIDRLMPGDLAWRHPQGAVFRVEDVEREQPRCDAFEISPTGPLFGYRMSQPTGEPGEAEQALIESEKIDPANWRASAGHRVKGTRRPVRFQPQDVIVDAGEDDAGAYVQLSFFLESGCYATAVLREVCKTTK